MPRVFTQRFSLSKVFSCELKFAINLLKKRLGKRYFRQYRELDFFFKQKFKKEKLIDWNKTNCVICDFCLPTVASNVPSKKISTYLDFVIANEHAFIRNIFDHDEIKL